jgi:RNA polymerase sigma-70 factor, ECF subfamily
MVDDPAQAQARSDSHSVGGDGVEARSARAEFGRIARHYDADLMRVAQRLCQGNYDWAADLVQETLVRAYQAFLSGNYKPDASPRPWLVRILMNHFINEYRRKQKWEAPVSPEILEQELERPGRDTNTARQDELPGVRLLSSLFDEEIEAALTVLSEPLRTVIILVDVEGMQYEEAAEALDVPIGTIRSRLSRARMQLQDLLTEYARKRGMIR